MRKRLTGFIDAKLDAFKEWLLNLDSVSITEIESGLMNFGLSSYFISSFLASPEVQSMFYRGIGSMVPIPVCAVIFFSLGVIQFWARHTGNSAARWSACVANAAIWTAFCVIFCGVSILMWQSGLGAVVVIGHFMFAINAVSSLICGCYIAALESEKRKRRIKMERLHEWMKKEGRG